MKTLTKLTLAARLVLTHALVMPTLLCPVACWLSHRIEDAAIKSQIAYRNARWC